MYLYLLFHLLRLYMTSCVYNIYRSSHRRCSLKKDVLKNFPNFAGKRVCWSFFLIKLQAWGPATLLKRDSNTGVSCKISKMFTNTYFEEHLQTTADQMICNKISLEKIRAVFHIYIKSDLNVKKTGWKKIRFQLTLNKTFCLTPSLLIHRRLKHRQKTKISKTMLSTSPSSVFHAKFTISVLKSK